MRLRPYNSQYDFDAIKDWIGDERTHAMWCGNRIPFPMEHESFDRVLCEHFEKYGDCPFVASDDSGKVMGFFCYCTDSRADIGFLRFVMVDPLIRGKGIGREMILLAVRYAFDIAKAQAVQLCVFPENEKAKRCYLSAGFREISTTPNAFEFGEEKWGRCLMQIDREV